MKTTQYSTDSGDVVQIEGRVDASTAKELETAVMAAVGSGDGLLVLDMEAVDYISSAGLRVLLIALKALAAKGRRLALAALNPDVLDVVKLTGFDKLLDCHDSVDAAMAGAAG